MLNIANKYFNIMMEYKIHRDITFFLAGVKGRKLIRVL